MSYFYLDFETRSAKDLRDYGADVHLADPHADVWCMGYALDDEKVNVATDESIPYTLNLWAQRDDTIFIAHNAQFEWQVWNIILTKKYGLPPIGIERFRCTMAAGYAMALPGSLDEMSAALGIEAGKDAAGSRLAVQMAKPRSWDGPTPIWWDDLGRLARLYAYCRQDVVVEREIHTRVRALSLEEQRLFELDARINRRGVYIDAHAATTALHAVAHEQNREGVSLWALTDGAVDGPSQVKKLTEWIKSQGVEISSLAKQEVIDHLATDELPPNVAEALRIRQAFAKTSTAKIDQMLACRSTDGRVKGTLQYNGSTTGRWAGRRVQPHNLPRPTIEQSEIEDILDYAQTHTSDQLLQYVRVFHGPPLARLSDCLRGLLCAAPGNQLYAGDFSNIEGRVLAWLAGDERKVQAFRDFDAGQGPDIYLLAAARIYHKPATSFTKKSPERQIGKVAELALGYQGGVGAFQTMAPNYGVKIPDDEADTIKHAWREAHPMVVNYWYALEHAALAAVSSPGHTTVAGRGAAQVRFVVRGSFLWCQLPSTRVLCYPYPKLEDVMTPWGEPKSQVTYKTVDSYTHQWIRTNTYGGKLSENITQAVARDCLVHSLFHVERAGWPVVLHVHDEIVAERHIGRLEDYLNLMRIPPPWAPGLPIAVEGWTGIRYRK